MVLHDKSDKSAAAHVKGKGKGGKSQGKGTENTASSTSKPAPSAPKPASDDTAGASPAKKRKANK